MYMREEKEKSLNLIIYRTFPVNFFTDLFVAIFVLTPKISSRCLTMIWFLWQGVNLWFRSAKNIENFLGCPTFATDSKNIGNLLSWYLKERHTKKSNELKKHSSAIKYTILMFFFSSIHSFSGSCRFLALVKDVLWLFIGGNGDQMMSIDFCSSKCLY